MRGNFADVCRNFREVSFEQDLALVNNGAGVGVWRHARYERPPGLSRLAGGESQDRYGENKGCENERFAKRETGCGF